MDSPKLAKSPWLAGVNVPNVVSMKPSVNKDDVERSTKDYKIWKEQMVCLLESQDLMGFIDGHTMPPEDEEELKLWRRTDRLIKGWILGSVSGTDVLDAVVELDSSRDVWSELAKIFTYDKVQTATESKAESSSCSKDDENTDEDYNYNRYLPLIRAALSDDWEEAKKFLAKDEKGMAATINVSSATVLHYAVETGKSNYFVRKLLQNLTPNELLAKSFTGENALHVAAKCGNMEAAALLVNANPDLLYITDEQKNLPVHLAAIYCHKETLQYLISVSKKDVGNSPFVGMEGARLLNCAISNEYIDVALYLVQKYPDLAILKDSDGLNALEVLADVTSVFPSGESYSWWQSWIYSSVPSIAFEVKATTLDIENPSIYKGAKKKFDLFEIITSVVPGAKGIKTKKLIHQQALELLRHLCKSLESLSYSKAEPIYTSAIIEAARWGAHEIVEAIIETFPDAIYTKEVGTNCSIFHVAARERHENVFGLFYRMNERKRSLYDLNDASGNNFMHMCGELAPPHKLNLVSGAALQMQRELQWFKEMEKFVFQSRRMWTNNAGKTPQMLFTEKHCDLKSQGEKWMKDTATSCTIAAALIATVVFAAVFTVPGGVHGDTGIPIFLQKTSFIIFAISDSVSMFTSTTSLLMFLSILTSRYGEQDFLYVLPKRLSIGLFTLFTSITFMMIAFSAAIYITLQKKSNLFLIPVGMLACFPVASFVFLQFPLLLAVTYSTYGPGIFGKKSNKILN